MYKTADARPSSMGVSPSLGHRGSLVCPLSCSEDWVSGSLTRAWSLSGRGALGFAPAADESVQWATGARGWALQVY
jgi:hypothetical protein